MANFRPPLVKDGTTARALDGARRAFGASPKTGPQSGRTLRAIAVSTSTTQVPHTLGRAYTGWTVTKPDPGGATVTEGTSADPKKFLALVGSASGTVDVLVF